MSAPRIRHGGRALRWGALFCILLSQLFFGALQWLSFEKEFTAIALSPYRIIGDSLAGDVQNNLDMGKTLGRFQAFPALAASAVQGDPFVRGAALLGSDGRLIQGRVLNRLGSTDGLFAGLPPRAFRTRTVQLQETPGNVHFLFPVTGTTLFAELGVSRATDDRDGFLDLVVDKTVYRLVLDGLAARAGLVYLGVTALVAVLALGLLSVVPLVKKDGSLRRLAVAAAVLTPLLAGQTGLSVYFFSMTDAIGVENLDKAAERHASVFAAKMQRAFDLGIRIGDISDLADSLRAVVRGSPGISALSIIGPDGKTVFEAGTRTGPAEASRSMTLFDANGTVQATVVATPNFLERRNALKANIMDAATSFVISLLLMSELMLLVLALAGRKREDAQPGLAQRGVLRGMAFFWFMALDLSISFIPLCMKQLSADIVPPPPVLLFGLPVSMEMAAASLTVLAAGLWAARRSPAPLLLLGLALTASGNLASALAATPLLYVLARILVGFGYGMAIMSVQNMVLLSSDKESRGVNTATFFVGVYAGSVCGSALGGMLAERLGFSPVFALSAAMIGFVLLVMFAARGFWSKDAHPVAKPGDFSPEGALSLKTIGAFVGDRRIASLFLLMVFPASVLAIGYMNFFMPVVLEQDGVGQSTMGRIFMTYSLVFILCSPLVSHRIEALPGKVRAIALGGCLGGMGLFFLALPAGWLPSVWSALGATVFASLSLVVGMPSQVSFLLGQGKTALIGNGPALSLYNIMERIGQVSGPMIFGAALILVKPAAFALICGLVLCGCSFLFSILAREKP